MWIHPEQWPGVLIVSLWKASGSGFGRPISFSVLVSWKSHEMQEHQRQRVYLKAFISPTEEQELDLC